MANHRPLVPGNAMTGLAPGAPVVSLAGITKRFPGVLANDSISIDFQPGETHALLGENGAGKSTLIGILAGMHQPDAGEIRVGGRAVRIESPRESLALGIGTVFQHVLLVPSLSVLENLMLGGSWWRALDSRAARERFQTLSATLGLELDGDAPVGGLALGQQQQVEIMRALWRGGRVLVLDEPTSMLTPKGVEDLGRVMERLRASGVAIVFITHKLREAHAFGSRISVLRLGRLVGSLGPDELRAMSEAQVTDAVIALMFGTLEGHRGDAETLLGQGRRRRASTLQAEAAPALALDGVATAAAPGECALDGVALEVRPGEILGIAGVDGNGQKHLAEVMAGQRRAAAGRVLIAGADATAQGVGARRRLGVRYVTDERLDEGTVGAFSVATNLVAKGIGAPPLWRRGVTLWDRVHAHARELIARHDVRTPSERTPIGRLSGGNIQKVLLARELDAAARVVVYNKPTSGLDLHNTHLARERIAAGAAAGLATVLISTELDELLALADRIAVMLRGRIVGVVANADDAELRVGRLMTGVA
jgi:simple sugar transport system ATP-binding protein